MWTCDVCSFAENSDARTICGLCEAAKPARARQPPQPVGPKWPCSVCTYLNLSSATSCLTCGTPRGATTPAAVPSQPAAPAPAPAARPSASPPTTSTPAGAPTVNEQDVKFLQSMGFVRSRCVAALQVNRDRDNALEWLLNQDAAAAKGSKPSPSPAPAAAPSSSISKPASSAASASRPTATSSASSSSSVSAKPASQPATSSVVQPLKQMSLNDNDKKALEEREAKRLALLKQLDEEAAEKARARAAAAAAVNSTQSVTTAATKKPVAASKQTTSSSSSSSSTSASSSAVSASSPANSKDSDDNLTPEQKRLAKIAAARAADAERRRMAALRVEKRLTAESKLKDIKQVCQALHANYDALRYTAILNLLQRILQNIVNDGGRTEKYLRIPLGPKVDQTLVRPIGPIWILKQAGFEEQVVKEKDDANMEDVDSSHTDEDEEKRVLVMPASKVNLSKIQSVLAALSQQLTAQKSNIPSVFEEMIASGKYSIEQVYYLAIELKMIVQNIIISTDEIDQARTDDDDNRRRLEGVNKNFRTLDKHESFYINRIKPISESKKILAELGFTLDPHDATRQFLVVPMDRLVEDDGVKKYQLIFRELNHILTTLRHRTPIAIELRKLCAQNRQKSMKKLMDILIPAIEAIVKEEHEQKYYKIVLDKVQAKIGTQPHQIIKGLLEFIQLFGFRPATQPDGTIDQHRVTMPYPTDVGLLKLRLDELKENWEELLQQAGAESGQSSTWSFD